MINKERRIKMDGSFVSIITLNYNGKQYLDDFLRSVENLDYPKDKYEIAVVDNASSDGSVDYLKKNYPDIKLIQTGKNLGFGGGNNYGIRKTKGDFVFLVNNDTVLDKISLTEGVKCFERLSKRKKIGAVTFKLLLMDKYIPVKMLNCHFSKFEVTNDGKPINKRTYVFVRKFSNRYEEMLYIPINSNFKDKLQIDIVVNRYRTKNYEIHVGGKKYTKVFKNGARTSQTTIGIGKSEFIKLRRDLIQNAGNYFFRDGFGRDRGAIVKDHNQYYETDHGQYDKVEVVPGFNGAGVILNRVALEDVGLFDERFFMYYEDGDLSLRMKRAGWNVVYCPKARIRHIHSASSKEWSTFFIYNVERNRLLLVAKHWPRLLAIKEWIKYIARDTIAVLLHHYSKKKKDKAKKIIKTRIMVNIKLIIPFTLSMFRTKRLSYFEIKKLL